MTSDRHAERLTHYMRHRKENFPLMRFEDLDARQKEEHVQMRRAGGKGKKMIGHNGGPPMKDAAPAPRQQFAQAEFRL